MDFPTCGGPGINPNSEGECAELCTSCGGGNKTRPAL